MEWLTMIVGLGLMWLPLMLLFTRLQVEGEAESQQTAHELGAAGEESGEPHFLAPSAKKPAPRRAVGDGTVIMLEDYLMAEREQAEKFIAKPSVGSLYRNCGTGGSAH